MNISLISLHILTLNSVSPFYTINRNSQKVESSFFNSQFTHSITSIIYSSTSFHSTTVDNCKFMQIINTPLVFSSETAYEGKCADGKSCCISKDYYYKPNEIISDINISQSSFPDTFGNKNAVFAVLECGDIKITNCQFIECFTKDDNGGGIFIGENCMAILHKCIFDRCHSAKNGGAGAIAQEIKFTNDINKDPCHDEAKRIDIQYTCFQGCYTTDGGGYGTVLLMGAKSITFYYASTIDCPPSTINSMPKGAQFDILSESISSQFINATGGKAIYCGSLEYRKATTGFFRYQTITNLECKYAMSFTSVDIDGLSITRCNVFNNKLIAVNGETLDKYSPPCLVFVRKENLLVEEFYFSQNDFGEHGKFASREFSDELNITLKNCYADVSATLWDTNFVTVKDCHFSDEKIETFPLRQLSLGLCQGDVAPGNMIITSLFTASSVYTKSDMFTGSNKFSKSVDFTHSDEFLPTYFFGQSNAFSGSNDFTESTHFQIIDKGVGESNKGNKGTIIGATVGSVAGVAVIVAIVAFFLIKRRKSLLEDAADMVNETDASITVDNGLQNIMDKDDPFDDDFNKDLPDIKQ